MCGTTVECSSAKRDPKGLTNVTFLERGYLPFLLNAQNADGGWGYRPRLESSVEPTAWVVLALNSANPHSEARGRAVQWLSQAQTKDGSWPAAGGNPGCWVTALACLALLDPVKPPPHEVLRGVRWLLNTWPAEGSLWRRFLRRWRKGAVVVRQDTTLRGWSWIPGTASWVEPTSYALILLRNVPAGLLPPGALRRRQLGERMLYDRVCPGGGWNAGNPMVYGVPGVPRITPTAWALLALVESAARRENTSSLDWLQGNLETVSGPGSLALAALCLKVHGRPVPQLEAKLLDMYRRNHFLGNLTVAALACLALGDIPAWSQSVSGAEA